ncbi:MAG: 2-C-methyl-D-erythritol 4-phosphate cytidylyltransferase [Rikenellaceae bacterium]
MAQRIDPKVAIVIVAGGSGRRVGGVIPKQFQFLGQKPLLAHTINRFAKALPLSHIVVVVAEDRVEYWRNLSARFEVAKHSVVVGGAERFDSVKAGVESLSNDVEIIGVQDGARPLCTVELIRRCVDSAISNGSAIPVVSVADSLREIVSEAEESRSVVRSNYRAVQTPQVFDATTLRRAYRQQFSESFTDDASVVESMGERVWLCEGDRQNIKITTAEDMIFARAVLERELELEKKEESDDEK